MLAKSSASPAGVNARIGVAIELWNLRDSLNALLQILFDLRLPQKNQSALGDEMNHSQSCSLVPGSISFALISYIIIKAGFGYLGLGSRFGLEWMTTTKMITHIKDKNLEWKCKVRVVEKRNIKDSQFSPNKYRPYILQDQEGTKVFAMANSRDIDQVDRVLDLNKTYNISNAVVLPSKYNVPPPSPHYKYIWMLSRQTYIEKAPESDQIEILNGQEDTVTTFYDFYNLIRTKTPINFMAVVLEKMPREYISVRETAKTAYDFTIVNEDMKPMLLTLWGDFAIYQGKEIICVLDSGRFPIFLGKRVIVNNFNGVSLSTRFDSMFEVNPTNSKSESLKKWRDDSIDLLKRYINLKTYKNALIALAYPPGQPKTKVVDIPEMNIQEKGVWVEVDMRIIDDVASFYIGCDYCNRKVCGPEGGNYRCLDCGNPHARAEKKYKIEVELTDETGQIVGTIFDEDFNRLLQITNTIHRSGSIDIAKLQAKLDGKKFFCEVRLDRRQFPGKSKQTYTINGVCENVKVSQSVGVQGNGFEHNMRLAPVITEEVTLSLEELIRKLIVEVDEEPSVGEDAFVWLATLIPVTADVVNARFTFETLTASSGSTLHYPAHNVFLKQIDKCLRHLQKQAKPTGIELAENEFILHVEGTATSQRVVRHIGGTSWPGRLTLTNYALYFEASGIISYEDALRLDLSKDNDQSVNPVATGLWGAPLFDKAIVYQSSQLQGVVLEFPEITSSTRREHWLALVKEIMLLHKFMMNFEVQSQVESWEMHARIILGIIRLHAAREMLRSSPPLPKGFLIFNLLDELPKGDYVLKELAGSLKMHNIYHPCSASSILKTVSVSQPSTSSTETEMIMDDAKGSSSPLLALPENVSSLEDAIFQAREEEKEINVAKATVQGVREEGIAHNILALQGLVKPFGALVPRFQEIIAREKAKNHFHGSCDNPSNNIHASLIIKF
ncbi:unnamed protein product [Cuscuta campestris]|uniref:Replication factor A C-terminal domain-containing protein n=1 Tax=Cuscuta campestris TaxID=132261 RepID=A0A484NL44_9ASTE|nr:unnamed protein product [Cuscuta campestris]